MFKPCPKCGFLVALIAGRGASQRCPRCGSALLEEGELPPAETPEPVSLSAAPQRENPPDDTAPVALPVGDGDAVGDVSTAGASGAVGPDPAAPSSEVATPSFAARRPAAASARRRPWPWVAVLALALLLALQLLLSQRAELAQDARWRPAVETLCAVLGCAVPAWHEPGAFAMLARAVRPHASRPGLLHVTTSLRNDAPWPQPLPVVVLSLSDVDGRTLAARAVAPRDYSRQPAALVAPGESVDIAFEVREPSAAAVSFDFQLR